MWFDRLTTNEINYLPFVLSLSKDLFRASLTSKSPALRGLIAQRPVDRRLMQRRLLSPPWHQISLY
jgi:hypothetical protein